MEDTDDIQSVVEEAITVGDIDSAAIFVVGHSSGVLHLAAAAGISGQPLDGLIAAVQRPDHPVAQAVRDPGPTFDARPLNPGGPALRSHLPLRRTGAAIDETFGVLALAHDSPTSAAVRGRLTDLAARATATLE
jgi:hypothetical protein